jgi:hypothetical protein
MSPGIGVMKRIIWLMGMLKLVSSKEVVVEVVHVFEEFVIPNIYHELLKKEKKKKGGGEEEK